METTTTYLGEQIKKNRYHVLIFAQNPESDELKEQLNAFQKLEKSIQKDKFDINIICNNRQSKDAYIQYDVPFNSFTVLVMNKDKQIDYRKNEAISSSELYNILH